MKRRWAKYLSKFDYTVKYVKVEHNILADTLSRIVYKEPESSTPIYLQPLQLFQL